MKPPGRGPATQAARVLAAVLLSACAGDSSTQPRLEPPANTGPSLLLVQITDSNRVNQIYTMTPAGQNIERLLNTSALHEVGARWSPDGRKVVYLRTPGSLYVGQLHVAHGDGSEDTSIAGPGFLGPPGWSPDGTMIAYDVTPDTLFPRRHTLMVVNADGSLPHPVLDAGMQDGQPSWSPDGATLAFTRQDSIYTGPLSNIQTVWLLDLHTGSARQLTLPDSIPGYGPADAWSPQWSADGHTIAFDISNGLTRVGLVADTGGAVSYLPRNSWSATWSPSGDSLAFLLGTAGDVALWMADGHGQNAHHVADLPGFVRQVSWR